jgi:hypothetical protein
MSPHFLAHLAQSDKVIFYDSMAAALCVTNN